MEFWIFMMITNLLLPLIMICFGQYFSKKAPKEINGVFGYRTTMSMKNKDTWNFAHNYCGKLWRVMGLAALVFSMVIMLFVYGKSTETVGMSGGIVCTLQTVFLLGSVVMTEAELKKNFDKDGKRKF